jgi:L-ascorbate metabolism protein UlaG (beta-lactamase superfamily)
MPLGRGIVAVALAAALLAPAGAARAAALPDSTIQAREHFFGAENVDAEGNVPRGRVILSWFSVASFAAAIDGHVVLLDAYIHKGEERPNYVPTTVDELADLMPEAIFIGHGHYDHAAAAGELVARTNATLVGSPEHCDQTRAQAEEYAGRVLPVKCVEAVDRGSMPGAEVRALRPLGDDVCVSAFKHVHSAAEPSDAEHRDPQLLPPPFVDPNSILFHPPGPSAAPGLLNVAGDEGATLLYQFRVGRFSLVWNDSAGPIRERAPQLMDVMRRMPPTDVHVNAVLGFNSPTNGVRDAVDYLDWLRPKVMFPSHHDYVAEYGSGDQYEQYMQREMSRRPEQIGTEIRWMRDPDDYVRPSQMTFDLSDPRWAQDAADPSRPSGTCGCPSRRKSRFKLHRAKSTRIVRAEAFVNGRRVLVRKGRDLRQVTLTLPATGKLKVRIVTTHTSGARLISTRTYKGCKKTKPVTRRARPR